MGHTGGSPLVLLLSMPMRYSTFLVVLAAILVAHNTVEGDDNGPEPIPQSEDSAAGGPFAKAMDEKHAAAHGLKKELDSQGGEAGIEHGGKLVKRWLKQADTRYRARGDKKTPDSQSEAEEEVNDDPDQPDADEKDIKGKKQAGEQVVEEEEEEKASEAKAVSDANEKVEEMEKKVEQVQEEAKKEKKEADEEMAKAKSEEAHTGDEANAAAKSAAKMAYSAEEHRAEVKKQGEAEAKIQVPRVKRSSQMLRRRQMPS